MSLFLKSRKTPNKKCNYYFLPDIICVLTFKSKMADIWWRTDELYLHLVRRKMPFLRQKSNENTQQMKIATNIINPNLHQNVPSAAINSAAP